MSNQTKKPKTSYSSEDRTVKGITPRPLPAGAGWCGSNDCKHLSHKRFHEAAKPVKA